ncbi:hypothetical protein OG592_01550 [Streptomyces avidinii]|uniref:hypothetical protein n=1 Tax=Streptomyces avidinii TaxID=1895 RepID=UPI00386B8C5C|nr:hypothetical protein OG592_01550 [Streptomyces avidinii]
MQVWKKAVLVCAAMFSGVVAITLVAVAIWGGLETADRAASVIGSVVGLTGLILSLWALLASRTEGGAHASGVGAVVAAGSIGRAVTGDRNRLSGPPGSVPSATTSTASHAPIRADGDRSVAAGESIGDAITGEGNTV